MQIEEIKNVSARAVHVRVHPENAVGVGNRMFHDNIRVALFRESSVCVQPEVIDFSRRRLEADVHHIPFAERF